MNKNIIIEDNTIYELDPECMKKRKKEYTGKKLNQKEQTQKKRESLCLLFVGRKKKLSFDVLIFMSRWGDKERSISR